MLLLPETEQSEARDADPQAHRQPDRQRHRRSSARSADATGWLVAATNAISRSMWPRCPHSPRPNSGSRAGSAEIDARVRDIVREGLSVYRVDGEALKVLAPDVIVTQDHCEVCAVSPQRRGGRHVHLDRALGRDRPRSSPNSTADVYADIRRVALSLDAVTAGEALVGGHATPHRRRAYRRCRPFTAARRLHRMGRAADGRRQLDARANRGGRRPQPVRHRRQALRLDCNGAS